MSPSGQPARPRERELFMQALEQPSREARDALLDRACGHDSVLRRRLAKLLEEFDRIGTFLDQPVVSVEDRPEAAAAPNGEAGGGTVLLPLTEKPGDHIGRYKLREKIGEGGCGLVYVAEQEEPVRRKVALKVIKLGMDTREVVARFEAERQALALMDHPNIAKVFDAGATETGRPYFVMELVRGIRITDYCDQNKLSTAERLDLFIQVCHAIQHAHQKGIIHRDIKPSNVLVTLHDGVPVPKVVDFGIAKAMEQKLTEKTIYTAFEQFIGTPAYTSPEQAEMSGLDIDTRSDIYALGVMLYELLTGKTPFDGQELLAAGLEEMRRTIREKEPVRPSTRLRTMLNGDLTTTAQHRRIEAPRLISLLRGDLDWIVMKCLEKDRTRRYETANGLALDIERHLTHEPVAARPPSTAYRVQKFMRRNKVMVGAASMVAAALVLGIMVSTWQAVRASRQRARAEANEQKALAAEAKEVEQRQRADEARRQAQAEAYASDMKAAQVALQQDNRGMTMDLLLRHLPKPGEEDLRGLEWRYLWHQSRSDEVRSFPHGSMVHGAVLTPDGRHMATAGQDGKVRVWETGLGKLLRDFPARGAFGIASKPIGFSPDGSLLAFAGKNGVEIRDTTSWNLVRELKSAGAPLGFSPNGKWLVAAGTNGLEVWEMASWTCLILTHARATANNLAFTPDGAGLFYASQFDSQLLCADLRTGTTSVVANVVGGANSVAVSPDGKWLALGKSSGELWLWDLASRRLELTFPAHEGFLLGLAFSPDSKWLATGGNDQVIHLWETGTTNRLATFQGHLDEIWSLAFSRDGQTLVSASKDGTVKSWNMRSPPIRSHSLILPTNSVPVGLLPDGTALVTLDKSQNVTWHWRLADGQVIQSNTWSQLKEPGYRYKIFPLNQRVVAVRSDGLVQVWSLMTGALLQSIQLEVGTAFVPGFLSPDDRWLLETQKNPFTLYDLKTGRRMQEFRASYWYNGHAVFSLNSRWLACGTTNYDVRLWDLAANQEKALLKGHKWHIMALRFSPDGKVLASSGWDAQVRLWSVETGRALGPPLTGHRSGLHNLDFSADGKTLASESGDRTVRWWNVATGKEMLLFPEVSFTPPYAWSLADLNPGGNLVIWFEHMNRRTDPKRESLGQSEVQITRLPTLAEIDAAEAQQAKDALPR